MSPTAALLLLAPALFADLTVTAPTDGDAFARLVPIDAVAVVRLAPLDDLEASAQDLLETLAPELLGFADLDFLALQAPTAVPFDLVDRERSLFGALRLPAGQRGTAPPPFCFGVPSTDPAALLERIGEPQAGVGVFAVDGYVVWTTDPSWAPTEDRAPLLASLPAGLVAGALDLGAVVDRFGPMAEAGLRQVEGQALTEIASNAELPPALRVAFSDLVAWGIDTLEGGLLSMDRVGFGIDLDGSVLSMGGRVTVFEGSAMSRFGAAGSTRAIDLLRLADPAAPVVAGLSFDTPAFADHVRPLLEALLDSVPFEEAPTGELGPFRDGAHIERVARELVGELLGFLTAQGDAALQQSYGGVVNPTATWIHGTTGQAMVASIQGLVGTELARMAGLQLTTEAFGTKGTRLTLRLDTDRMRESFALEPGDVEDMRFAIDTVLGGQVQLDVLEVSGLTLSTAHMDDALLSQVLRGANRAQSPMAEELRMAAEALGDAHPWFVFHANLSEYAGGMLSGLSDLTGSMGGPPSDAAELEAAAARLAEIDLPVTFWFGARPDAWFDHLQIDLAGVRPLIELLGTLE